MQLEMKDVVYLLGNEYFKEGKAAANLFQKYVEKTDPQEVGYEGTLILPLLHFRIAGRTERKQESGFEEDPLALEILSESAREWHKKDKDDIYLDTRELARDYYRMLMKKGESAPLAAMESHLAKAKRDFDAIHQVVDSVY